MVGKHVTFVPRCAERDVEISAAMIKFHIFIKSHVNLFTWKYWVWHFVNVCKQEISLLS